MSFDLGVWHAARRIDDAEAGALYAALCDLQVGLVEPHPVDAFYEELTARYPEIDTVPDERIDDHDYCPWCCALDRSPGHVIMPCVWSQADNVRQFVHTLARKHGLAVFDPQEGRVTYPDR